MNTRVRLTIISCRLQGITILHVLAYSSFILPSMILLRFLYIQQSSQQIFMRVGSLKNLHWDSTLPIPILSKDEKPHPPLPLMFHLKEIQMGDQRGLCQTKDPLAWTKKRESRKKIIDKCDSQNNLKKENRNHRYTMFVQNKCSNRLQPQTFFCEDVNEKNQATTIQQSHRSISQSHQLHAQNIIRSIGDQNLLTNRLINQDKLLEVEKRTHYGLAQNYQKQIKNTLSLTNSGNISSFKDAFKLKHKNSNMNQSLNKQEKRIYFIKPKNNKKKPLPSSRRQTNCHTKQFADTMLEYAKGFQQKGAKRAQFRSLKKLMTSQQISLLHEHDKNSLFCNKSPRKFVFPHVNNHNEQSKHQFTSSKQGSHLPNFLQKKKQVKKHGSVLKLRDQICLKVLSNREISATFHIIKLLANNQVTTTYLVREVHTNFLYCLKKCPVKTNKQQFDLLIREGKIGGYLDHPLLLKTYCTLYDNENIYQLIQYMEGSTLLEKTNKEMGNIYEKRVDFSKKASRKKELQVLQNKRNKAKLVLLNLLDGILYMHEAGLIHRDVKPSNVFISHQLSYKIGDFGSVGFQGSKQYIGTLDYVTPQVLLRKKYDKAVDMWSLGCIAYELWTGIPPFYHDQRQITIDKIIEQDFDRGKVEDPILLDLISKLLDKDPSKRITADQALKHPFLQQISIEFL